MTRDQHTSRRPTLSVALLALLVGAGLAACQPSPETPAPRTSEPTVGQKIDGAVAEAEKKGAEIKADVKEATAEMRADTNKATDAAGSAVKDAAITAAVNAKLAADPSLSAFRINVDTAAGRVALSGDAPDASSRERASTLARSVDGVVEVNNQLTLKSKG